MQVGETAEHREVRVFKRRKYFLTKKYFHRVHIPTSLFGRLIFYTIFNYFLYFPTSFSSMPYLVSYSTNTFFRLNKYGITGIHQISIWIFIYLFITGKILFFQTLFLLLCSLPIFAFPLDRQTDFIPFPVKAYMMFLRWLSQSKDQL